MAGKKLQLQIYTPRRTFLYEDLDFVLMKASEGDIGILPGHEACSVMLDSGIMRIFKVRSEPAEEIAVIEGFATVKEDNVVVLSGLAERPDRLQATLADMERELEENRINEQAAELEMHRMETALRHALVKMDISAYSILKGKEEKEDKDESK